jgi:hypothetical protein
MLPPAATRGPTAEQPPRIRRRRLLSAAAALTLAWLPDTAAAQAAALHGRVLSAATGQPIPNATVSLAALAREARSDSLGQFTLSGMRPGEYELVVRAVGYAPARAIVPLTAGPALELDVDLDLLPPVLDSVVTEADIDAPRNFFIREFEARRVLGFGRFVTRAELLRQRGRTLEAILRSRVPGVRYLDVNGMIVAASGRDQSRLTPCYVNVIVDGVLRYTSGVRMQFFDLRSLEVSMIAGIEYYTPASTPAEFNLRGHAACGTLVIWLQH